MGKRIEAAILGVGLTLFAGGAYAVHDAAQPSPEASAALDRAEELLPVLHDLVDARDSVTFDRMSVEADAQLTVVQEDLDARDTQMKLGLLAVGGSVAPVIVGASTLIARGADALDERRYRREEAAAPPPAHS